jgi:hypothetical protein
MTLYVSLAVFKRNGVPTFRPPRKEAPDTLTQARKAAARYWSASIVEPDKIHAIYVMAVNRGLIDVSECNPRVARRSPWVSYTKQAGELAEEGHFAAALTELGIDIERAPSPLPDVLEVNGVLYRREI